jgi:hypothetical protein
MNQVIIPGHLYVLKGNSRDSFVRYKYILNSYGKWIPINKKKKLVPIDVSEYLNVPILCIAEINHRFGIFLAGEQTVGIGIFDLEKYETKSI